MVAEITVSDYRERINTVLDNAGLSDCEVRVDDLIALVREVDSLRSQLTESTERCLALENGMECVRPNTSQPVIDRWTFRGGKWGLCGKSNHPRLPRDHTGGDCWPYTHDNAGHYLK